MGRGWDDRTALYAAFQSNKGKALVWDPLLHLGSSLTSRSHCTQETAYGADGVANLESQHGGI